MHTRSRSPYMFPARTRSYRSGRYSPGHIQGRSVSALESGAVSRPNREAHSRVDTVACRHRYRSNTGTGDRRGNCQARRGCIVWSWVLVWVWLPRPLARTSPPRQSSRFSRNTLHAPGHAASAKFTARIIPVTSTLLPSRLTKPPQAHSNGGMLPSAIPTSVSNSFTVTSPDPSQSPAQPSLAHSSCKHHPHRQSSPDTHASPQKPFNVGVGVGVTVRIGVASQ